MLVLEEPPEDRERSSRAEVTEVVSEMAAAYSAVDINGAEL